MAYLQVKVSYSLRVTKWEIKIFFHDLNWKWEAYIANKVMQRYPNRKKDAETEN